MYKKRLLMPLAAVAAAFALAACGGSSGGGGGDAGMTGDTGDTGDTGGSDRTVSGYVAALPQTAALLALLPTAGDSHTITVPAGMTLTRAGVTFTCTSSSSCMVTLTNDLGEFTAHWSSTVASDADDPVVLAGTGVWNACR